MKIFGLLAKNEKEAAKVDRAYYKGYKAILAGDKSDLAKCEALAELTQKYAEYGSLDTTSRELFFMMLEADAPELVDQYEKLYMKIF